MAKNCLSADIVEAVEPPEQGETWLGDNHVRHFGLRAWAGKKGGGKAFAIRLRDQFGIAVRETYEPERDFPLYHWYNAWEKPLSYFLEHAREWARERAALHLGRSTSESRRHKSWHRRRARILATRIGDAIDRKIAQLKRKSRDHLYVDHIRNMVGEHIPQTVLAATFRNVPIRQLADAISNRNVSYGNVKVLRSFIGGVFTGAARDHGALKYKLESIQRRCAKNLDARKAPPYPEILKITREDYQRFFDALEGDYNWRQSLALRLYFATEARLQPVLRARWSDFLGKTWYPFLPADRKLWFESKQHIRPDSLQILKLIEQHHRNEGLTSPYLFPAPADASKPIRTVQRHWSRWCDVMGWKGLPLSHVVLRHQGRSNPSYSLFFHRYYLDAGRPDAVRAASKVAKRRKNKLINAMTYTAERMPAENLIA